MLIGEHMWYLQLKTIYTEIDFCRRDTACHFGTAETKRLSHAALEAQHFLFIYLFFKAHSCPIMFIEVGRRGCKCPECIHPISAIHLRHK